MIVTIACNGEVYPMEISDSSTVAALKEMVQGLVSKGSDFAGTDVSVRRACFPHNRTWFGRANCSMTRLLFALCEYLNTMSSV
jgi:hypothetical protein